MTVEFFVDVNVQVGFKARSYTILMALKYPWVVHWFSLFSMHSHCFHNKNGDGKIDNQSNSRGFRKTDYKDSEFKGGMSLSPT